MLATAAADTAATNAAESPLGTAVATTVAVAPLGGATATLEAGTPSRDARAEEKAEALAGQATAADDEALLRRVTGAEKTTVDPTAIRSTGNASSAADRARATANCAALE